MFRIVCDSEGRADLALVEAVNKNTPPLPTAQLKCKSAECPVHDSTVVHLLLYILNTYSHDEYPHTAIIHPCDLTPRPIVHPYVCSKSSFNICSIVPRALPSVGMILLDLMLYNKR